MYLTREGGHAVSEGHAVSGGHTAAALPVTPAVSAGAARSPSSASGRTGPTVSSASGRTGPTVPSASGRPIPRVLPAVAGQPLLDLLTGPLRPATVAGVHPAAVIVAVDPMPGIGAAPTRIVAVVAADGSGVPHGLRIALASREHPFAAVRPGDPAFVGAGGVRLSGFEVRVVRSARTQVPRVSCPPEAVAQIAAAADLVPRGVPAAAVDDLRAAIARQDATALRRAVRSLVGLGAGSTPGGDDVVAGTLAGLHATGRDVLVHQIWVAAREDLARRTTMISADLLRLAADGHGCAEAIAVLVAAARRSRRTDQRAEYDRVALAEALRRLLSLGHTSGADLATGLAIGLSAPTYGVRSQPRLGVPGARPPAWGPPSLAKRAAAHDERNEGDHER